MPSKFKLLPATPRFPWPSLDIDIDRLVQFTEACIAAKVKYGLGAKVQGHAKPGATGFKRVDCSGFVREALYQATQGKTIIVDGSVNQHEAVRRAGFKLSTPSAGNISDGALRIAFLSPQDGGGIGHVLLIHNDQTLESHGGVGVDRREWGSKTFMSEMEIYVLTPPQALVERAATSLEGVVPGGDPSADNHVDFEVEIEY